MSAVNSTHKLIYRGKGADLWGECSCQQWAWLGMYEMSKGRHPKLRIAHAEHVTWARSVVRTEIRQAGTEIPT